MVGGMMTSRSEYRLVLRQDNADLRLTETGYSLGLIGEERYRALQEKTRLINAERKRVKAAAIAPSKELNTLLTERGTAPLETGTRLSDLIRRPQLDYACLTPFDKNRPELPPEIFEQVEIGLKYEGYIKRQEADIKEARRLEEKELPEDIDYKAIKNLRLEAAEKLSKIRPQNVGQAARVSGVSPADISVLLIYLRKNRSETER